MTTNKDMEETMTASWARCGNTMHPDGPWHEAAPLPASWQWRERYRQWRNIKRWGCSCYSKTTPSDPPVPTSNPPTTEE